MMVSVLRRSDLKNLQLKEAELLLYPKRLRSRTQKFKVKSKREEFLPEIFWEVLEITKSCRKGERERARERERDRQTEKKCFFHFYYFYFNECVKLLLTSKMLKHKTASFWHFLASSHRLCCLRSIDVLLCLMHSIITIFVRGSITVRLTFCWARMSSTKQAILVVNWTWAKRLNPNK